MRPCKYLFLATAALVALSWVATPSEAQWRRGYGGYRGGYGGYYRGFYPRYGYGYGYRWPGYYWGGYPGIGIALGGYRYGWPSYYGGSYYPSYGYGTAYYPTYDYYPSYSYGTVYAPTVASPPADTASTRTSAYYAPPTDNTAHVRVHIPANAELWVAGERMQQTGPDREFVSPALTPGKNYYYEMTARWAEGDRPVEQTRRVNVRANETADVSFGPER